MNTITDTVTQLLSNFSLGSITLNSALEAIIIFIICLILIKVIGRILDRLIIKIPAERGVHELLNKTIKVISYIIASLIALSILGIPISSLIAFFSVVGLAASLAAQNSLSQIAGGITLMVSRPFIVDDYINIGEIEGTVTHIGLIYTQLKTFDAKVISVPNNDMAAAKIINYSSEKLRRIDYVIGASYDNSIDQVKEAIKAAIASQELILEEPAPYINVASYGDSSINYCIRVWVNNQDYWPVWAALLEQIKHNFDSHGVEMSYNHLNIHLLEKK